MIVTVLSYVADAVILGTYALGRHTWFDWANALGSIPLLILEATTGAWAVMPLTGAFGLIGWWHIANRKRQRVLQERNASV